MKQSDKYKRLIIQNSIDNCREFISDWDATKNLITLTQDQKEEFLNLGTTLKAFLSYSPKGFRKVTNPILAKEYLKRPISTMNRIFFIADYKGLNRTIAVDMLNKIEKIADEQFGKLEDTKQDEKEAV